MYIEKDGKKHEAYNLIMKKENALDIINGKKVLEIRAYTPFYASMFTDEEQLALNEELREQGRDEECVEPLKGIEYVHFHNYNNSWSLDVRIDDIGICSMDEEDLSYLAEDFDFHDYDEEWQQYEHLPYEEKPMFYYLHVAEIINRENI